MTDGIISKRSATERLIIAKTLLESVLQDMPTAEPSLDEWCTDCKEYDHERHCCPRFNRVIQETVEELKVVRCGECIYYNAEEHLCNDLMGFGRYWEPWNYCSYGERRTDG